MWVIHRHATIAALFGVAVIGVWLLRRHRGASADELEPLTVLGVLVAAQGLVGSVQYELHLPADMVWVHVALATLHLAGGAVGVGRRRAAGATADGRRDSPADPARAGRRARARAGLGADHREQL